MTAKSLELINRGISSNQFLQDLMANLTPEQRQTVHTAIGYLAQAIHPDHNFSKKG